MTVRTARQAWRRLAIILASVEGCVEACARLDAHRRVDTSGALDPDLRQFEARMRRLEDRIDFEIDQITAEGLLCGLAERKAQGAQDRPAA